MTLTYTEKDRVSATRDMIALYGEMITVAGRNVQAHVESGPTSQEASEYGIDDYQREYSVTFIADSQPDFSDRVTLRATKCSIDSIDTVGANIYTLTVSPDEFDS